MEFREVKKSNYKIICHDPECGETLVIGELAVYTPCGKGKRAKWWHINHYREPNGEPMYSESEALSMISAGA